MRRYEIIEDVSSESLSGFDAVIDVRSPSEFAEDRAPGAINLPVLSDDERAEVGTIYTQESPFKARRLGAALVSANTARHLQGPLADKPKSFSALVYCWRGGMRSNAFATVLAAVGWRIAVLEGGYQRWRRTVVAGLDATAPQLDLVLVDGRTGTAKTAVLHALVERGEQVIDLEGLANHRGSAFGAFQDRDQPSQKAFESALWSAMRDFDPARPVFVEAESSLVGRRRVPNALWAAMKAARRIEIAAPLSARAAFLTRAYADIAGDPDTLTAAIEKLRGRHANADIDAWIALARSGEAEALAAALMQAHYDPAYARARERHGGRISATVEAGRLDAAGVRQAAEAVRDAARQEGGSSSGA